MKCSGFPFSCAARTNKLYKPYSPGVYHIQQTQYQPVVWFTYLTVLVTLNNYNNIQFTNKYTSSKSFDAIHKITLHVIRDNVASLVQSGKFISMK